MTGVVILVVAVVLALAFGLHRQRVDGRFGPSGSSQSEEAAEIEAVAAPGTPWAAVAAVLPDARPGEHATLVQFSSAFCAPCRTTRVVLDDVARTAQGVAHLEIDAEQHLALVRELDVRRTPTTLILDGAGRELTRAAGAPRRDQVLAALPARSQETP